MTRSEPIHVCRSTDLLDGGVGVPFEVVYLSEPCHAFAVRYKGTVYAYLNRCAHVPMELDYLPNQFFDHTGHWLICATHGALYVPETGQCRLGPCQGGLVKIEVSEADGQVHWHTSDQLQPEKPL